MTSPLISKIISLRGRLVRNPTSIFMGYPYGGTALGLVHSAAFVIEPRVYTVRAEEFGGQAVETIWTGDQAVFSAVLRDWDADAVASVMAPAGTVGVTGQPKIVRTTGQTGHARGLLGPVISILFAPIAEDDHPWIYLPRALAVPASDLRLEMSAAVELGLAMAFWAVPDNTGRTYEIGRRSEITVP